MTAATQRTAESAGPFVDRLVAYGSSFGRQLAALEHTPLREYLRSLFAPPDQPDPRPWLGFLMEAMARHLDAAGHAEASAVCSGFERWPVLQQSDHSALLLDAETFLNNYLFHVAAREAGVPYAVNSQCSTVVCFSRRVPPRGPVFLRTRGGLYNVFGLSKTVYKNASFCALPGPLTMKLEAIEGPAPAADPLLSDLCGRTFDDAADAYRICNERIWQRLAIEGPVIRVQVDERMTSEAIALHLTDAASPVHRLLFDPAVRDAFLEAKRTLVDSPRNIVINRAEPDWFWYRKGPRLHPVVLTGTSDQARFVIETTGEPLPIPYASKPMAAALRSGDLVGDRVLSYLVRCLLPGAVAVGGSVQQDYVDCYQLMVRETQRVRPFLDERDARTADRPDLSRIGGATLIEPDADDQALLTMLGTDTDLSELDRRHLGQPVGRTIGRLDCVWFYEDNLLRVDERRRSKGGQ